MKKYWFEALLSAVVLASALLQQATAQVMLDSSFRGKGFSLHAYTYGSGSWPAVGAAAAEHAVLSTGKILTCGSGFSSGTLYRFTDTGSIDLPYGGSGDGALSVNVCGMPLHMAKLAGDSVLLYGQAGSGYALAKFDSAGNPCGNFGYNGSLSRSIPELAWFGCTPTALVVQPDGKIVIAASANTMFPPTVVMRLLANGDYDSTFGTNGYTYLPFGSCGFTANRLFIQSTGKIIVTGDYFTTNSNPFYGACRLRTDGVVDSTFGTNGEAHTYVQINSRVSASYLQADDRIIVSGHGGYMIRYSANGVLDTVFQAARPGGRFMYQYRFGHGNVATDIQDDSIGRHYVYGRYQVNSSNATLYWFYVQRLHPDGEIDSSFNGTGYFDYAIRTPTHYPQAVSTRSMRLLPDNKILLYGDVWYYSTVNQIFLAQIYIHPYLEVTGAGRQRVFCMGDTARLQVHTSAGSVHWLRNGVALTDSAIILPVWQSGTYTAVTTYMNGKAYDTSDNITLSFHTPSQPVIGQTGNTLSVGTGYAAYQWVDSTGNPVPGATGSTFVPLMTGSYTVRAIDSMGCSSESIAFTYMPLGVANFPGNPAFAVSPNPARDVISLQNSSNETLQLRLQDIAGRVIWVGSLAGHSNAIVRLPGSLQQGQVCILHFSGGALRGAKRVLIW